MISVAKEGKGSQKPKKETRGKFARTGEDKVEAPLSRGSDGHAHRSDSHGEDLGTAGEADGGSARA